MEYKYASKRFLGRKYDELYKRAVKLLETLDNPCKIENEYDTTWSKGKLVGTKCAVSCLQYSKDNRFALCCGGFCLEFGRCKHLSKTKGCKVNSLRCKVWFCGDHATPKRNRVISFHIKKGGFYLGETNVPIYNDEHAQIINEMNYYNFGRLFRANKKETLEEAYKFPVWILKKDLTTKHKGVL